MRQVGRGKNSVWMVSFFAPMSSASRRPIGRSFGGATSVICAIVREVMRLEHLTEDEEDFWRGEFAQENWIFGALALSITLPEFAGGIPELKTMHFGYYLQPLHLNADD